MTTGPRSRGWRRAARAQVTPRTRWRAAFLFVAAASGCHGAREVGARVVVSNEDDGTVSIIDARSRTVTATISVGKRPRGVRVSRDGHFLYVALSGSPKAPPGVDESKLPPPDRASDGIGVVDLATRELVRLIPSGVDPEAFDLADANTLVVSNEETGLASIVDLDKHALPRQVAVGGEPEGVTTAPDGSVWITSEAENRATAIDPRTGRILATVATGLRPRAIAFTPDGTRGYVTDEGDASITIVDAKARRWAGRIELARGARPMGIAVTPGGHHAYVTTGRAGQLVVVDLERNVVVRTVTAGARPWGVAIGGDGLVYTANGPSNDVAVIDPDAGKVVATIHAGASPWGVAVVP
jgi:YVTN family beta-propeller protein